MAADELEEAVQMGQDALDGSYQAREAAINADDGTKDDVIKTWDNIKAFLELGFTSGFDDSDDAYEEEY